MLAPKLCQWGCQGCAASTRPLCSRLTRPRMGPAGMMSRPVTTSTLVSSCPSALPSSQPCLLGGIHAGTCLLRSCTHLYRRAAGWLSWICCEVWDTVGCCICSTVQHMLGLHVGFKLIYVLGFGHLTSKCAVRGGLSWGQLGLAVAPCRISACDACWVSGCCTSKQQA